MTAGFEAAHSVLESLLALLDIVGLAVQRSLPYKQHVYKMVGPNILTCGMEEEEELLEGIGYAWLKQILTTA